MTDHDRWLDENGGPLDQAPRGLVSAARTLTARRRALGIFGGVALTSLLAACGAQADETAGATTTPQGPAPAAPTASATAEASAPLGEVPDETAGPYPGDG